MIEYKGYKIDSLEGVENTLYLVAYKFFNTVEDAKEYIDYLSETSLSWSFD